MATQRPLTDEEIIQQQQVNAMINPPIGEAVNDTPLMLQEGILPQEPLQQAAPAQFDTAFTPEQAQQSQIVVPMERSVEDPTGAGALGQAPLNLAINAYQDIAAGTQQEKEVTAKAQEIEARANLEAVETKGKINKVYQDKLAEIKRSKEIATTNYFDLITSAPKSLDRGRWWKSLSTSGKIRAGIAQLMAGLGGARVDPIGSAIKADIEDQKHDYLAGKEKTKGIYSYFKNMGKSDMEAVALAHSASLKQVDDMLNAQLLTTKPMKTRAAILGAKGKVKVEQAKNLQKLLKEKLDRDLKKQKMQKEGRIHLEGSTLKRYEVSKEIVDDLTVMINQLEGGAHIRSYKPWGDTKYTTAQRNVVDLIARDRTGAVINDSERGEYQGMMARLGEGSKFQIQKAKDLRRKFKKKINLMLRGSKGGLGEPLQLEDMGNKSKLKKPGFSKKSGKIRLKRKTRKK